MSVFVLAKKKKLPALFQAFLKYYFAGVSEDTLDSAPADQWLQSAESTWQFYKHRSPKSPRAVRVFHIRKGAMERSVLEVASIDSPFLLDSIISEIGRSGHRIRQVIHPILCVERNSKGMVIAMGDFAGRKSYVAESLIHIEMNYIGDAAPKLEEAMERVLVRVAACVADWPAMRAKLAAVREKLPAKPKEEVAEVREFIDWLYNDHFILLGCREYRVTGKDGVVSYNAIPESELGLFTIEREQANAVELEAMTISSSEKQLVQITKSVRKSQVHRPVPMDYLGFKIYNTNGVVTGEQRFLGLFTSSVYHQSARLIPLIRKKFDAIIKRANFVPRSHNAKSLVAILENYPRDELLQISSDDLYHFCMGIIDLEKRPRVGLFLREDPYRRFLSALVYVPRERYNTAAREKIQKILEQATGGTVTDHYAQITDSPLARLHLIIQTNPEQPLKLNDKALERKIEEVTSSWAEGLRERAIGILGEKEGERLFHLYWDAFPASFMSRYHYGGTVRDILKLEKALSDSDIGFDLGLDLYRLEGDTENQLQLKIFHPSRQITLSEILPTLEFMGFKVLDSLTFQITPIHHKSGLWTHHFRLALKTPNATLPPLANVKTEFEYALSRIWHQQMENDALGALILSAQMRVRDVILLRAYSKYLRQTVFSYSHDFMAKTLAQHPTLAQQLVALFHARFGLKTKQRNENIAAVIKEIEAALMEVSNVSEDKIIRRFMDTIMATWRTNFFQDKDYISLKLDSSIVPELPKPRPYAEIFVYSHAVEGIHLRGGKVARGGLRWSDRREDFRTEILGLMKAQMVKNAVIVPVGSKGGFVVKNPPKDSSREAQLEAGIACYKTFLRGLLDITDNIVNGKVIPPEKVVRHDEDDPYLVVAADKGTAAFSDIANGVSAEYNFWLGDAFASGGSAGYDHKKMGITAKGAWVSVERHFREMGKDIATENFTAIGIGDMAGDVFGNGMLLSKNIQLVAAFNHQHIFIDPTPDAKKSFAERARLFALPRSSWSDYNVEIISAGGGVFERKAKTIKLTKEIRKRFDIETETITPDELIRRLLMAEVDLLWNGGIGTYVKATDESHDQVGDRANDVLRVNGNEVRAKVVGEGGNLGFTQAGRIEYALKGGRINTDAIDNSAGVDCSDHEVNIKIALDIPMKNGKLTEKSRVSLLASMTGEVENIVLRDNVLQTAAISIAQSLGAKGLDAGEHLMRKLEREGLLHRKIEFLPDAEEMGHRFAEKIGFTRPEIAVLLAYSKMSIFKTLMETNLPDDPYFNEDLLIYFPPTMVKKFQNDIPQHPLHREIIATFATNSMVNRMGLTFFHQIVEDTGQNPAEVARAYAIARDAFGLRALWAEIETLDGVIPASSQHELFLEITAMVERVTLWLLRNVPQPINVTEAVQYFKNGVEEIASYLEQVMAPATRKTYDRKLERFLAIEVPEKTARKFAALETLSSACEILNIQKNCKKTKLRTIAETYYAIGNRLSLGFLRTAVRKTQADTYWQRLAQRNFLDGFYDQQMRLTQVVLGEGSLEKWLEVHAAKIQKHDIFMQELRALEYIDTAILMVASRRVESLLPV